MSKLFLRPVLISKSLIKILISSPGWCISVGLASSHELKDPLFNPGRGICTGCGFDR